MSARKITSAKRMAELWEAFKDDCDNQSVLTHDFSSKNSEFVSKELKRSITYTILGFCVYAGISMQVFYSTYVADKRYSEIVTRMKQECEWDARRKFETGVIPTQLAGLWMSKHGYSTKETQHVIEDKSQSILDALAGKAETVFAKDEKYKD